MYYCVGILQIRSHMRTICRNTELECADACHLLKVFQTANGSNVQGDDYSLTTVRLYEIILIE